MGKGTKLYDFVCKTGSWTATKIPPRMHRNSPHWNPKSNIFLGRGHSPLLRPLLQWGGRHPLPTPTPSSALPCVLPNWTLKALLSTHADWAGCGYIVYCLFVRLCVCTVTDFSAQDKASGVKFCTQFIGVQGRESPIFVNFAPPLAQNRTNRPTRGPRPPACEHYRRDAPT